MKWYSSSSQEPYPRSTAACRETAIWLRMAAAAAALALGAGCVQIDAEVTLREDRSGSAVVTYIIGEQSVAQLRSVIETADRLAVAGNLAPASGSSAMRVLIDPKESSVRQYIESLASYGVSLSDLRIRNANGKRSVRVGLAFTDLQKAVTAPPLRDANLRFGRRNDGMWELSRDGAASTNALMSAAVANSLAPTLGGFSARIKVRTPGAIVETTAPKKSPMAVAWEFDFNREPQSVEQAFYAPLRVVYAQP